MTAQLRAATDHLIGNFLLGRYRVVRELAKGGMGVVYLARAEGAVGFVKPVVIKLLLPEHAQDDRFVRMFVREAQILSQLRHPSLVDVLEFGEEDGAYVLVLEYVRGYHLGQWLRYLTAKKRVAPAEILLQITVDVLEALHHAHNQLHPDGSPMQIVHRDVSPSNILLDEDGRARLLDFGVARMRGGNNDYKTQVDGIMGKLPYTAPELFAGIDASPRSDLYACGVVLHEALLGRNVFRTEMQAATLQKVMTYVPEALESTRSDIPAGLDAVLAKALAKASDSRHADAREFATALRKLQPAQESDIRAQLASLLKDDFGAEMAELLNLESLAHRDEAWRRLSLNPARRESSTRSDRNSSMPNAAPERSAGGAGLSAPSAIGATVAKPMARSPRQSRPSQAPGASEPAPERTSGARSSQSAPPARAPDGQSAPPSAASASFPAREPRSTSVAARRRVAEPSRASRNLLLSGVILASGLALSAMVISLRRPNVAPVAAVPAIRVVSAPIETPPRAAPIPTLATPTANPDQEAPVHKEERPHHAGPDPHALTRAFRKQQPKLEDCFRQHSIALQGRPTAQLDFDLDGAGKLTRVVLEPPALAATALGGCLLQVARATAFPAQGRAVSFAIPLSARGSAGD
jgi:eukaryotic-like serine/threonine-protein kinase